MTEPIPDADRFGPTLPITEACGCEVGQGHVCRPPWLTEDEWADQ